MAAASEGGDEETWFTHDVCIAEASVPRLQELLGGEQQQQRSASALGGAPPGAAAAAAPAAPRSRSSRSSGWSELDLEVERLAAALSRLKCDCSITVSDYARNRARFVTGLTNGASGNLPAFLAKERPAWSRVRWIHVDGGVSGDVLAALAAAHDLQPLALEDTTTFQRVKIDSYREHLFVTTYVWDLVDRRRRAKQRQRQREAAAAAAAGGDVERGGAAAPPGTAAASTAARGWRRWLPFGKRGGGGGARRRRSAPVASWEELEREERRRGARAAGSGGSGGGGGRGKSFAAGAYSAYDKRSGGYGGDDDDDSSSGSSSGFDSTGFDEPATSSSSDDDDYEEEEQIDHHRHHNEHHHHSGHSHAPAAAGGGAGAGASATGAARPLQRTLGRVWRDDSLDDAADDPVQAAYEGWQQELRQQRDALVREWRATVAQAGSGGGGAGGGGEQAAASEGGGGELPGEAAARLAAAAAAGVARDGSPARRKHSPHRGSLSLASPSPFKGAVAAAGGGCGGSSHRGAGGAYARSRGGDGSHAALDAACRCHLGVKHRRRARLRTQLQTPFYAYQTSGRSLGRKAVMIEQASFFVCPGGVLISLFQKTGAAVAAPVLARLRGMQSLLVESEDAGVLLQALLQARRDGVCVCARGRGFYGSLLAFHGTHTHTHTHTRPPSPIKNTNINQQSTLDYSVPVFEAFAAKVAGVDLQLVRGRYEICQSRRLVRI